MSALGQKRTLALRDAMSALPPKADIREREPNVCYGPKGVRYKIKPRSHNNCKHARWHQKGDDEGDDTHRRPHHCDRGSNDFLVSAGCRASARPVSFLSMVRHGSKSDQVDPECEHDHSER
jgi:hypothetical protein